MYAKRNAAKSSQEEQLYMLEVLIDRVTVDPDRVSTVEDEKLVVCVRFIDLPECQIGVPNDEIDLKKKVGDTDESKGFKYGKSCLFTKTPSCLIRAIRWSPLCLDVYRTQPVCLAKKNRVLLGTARVSLPTCMCDHVTKSLKDVKPSSAPCTVTNTFDLIDANDKPFGSVSVLLRLTCFGSSMVQDFSLNDKAFVSQQLPLQKFLCPRRTIESQEDTKGKDGKPLLTRPGTPPRATMNDPTFKTLTNAEKMNDRNYRELIYRAYPNEPTCRCLPNDRCACQPKHPMKCRAGCMRPCCMKLRNPGILATQPNRHVNDALLNTCCINDPSTAWYALNKDSPYSTPRLRGGGDLEQLYVGTITTRWNDNEADYLFRDEKLQPEARLEGGGGELNMSSCGCSGNTVPVPLRKSMSQDRDVVRMFNACTPRVTPTGPKPTCPCPGKEVPTWPRGAARCMKKPCMGIDCLIRAFEDAQEFVNSIGKVPGLPGLGLMDPSESPYFGRDIDKDYVTGDQALETQKKKAQPGMAQKAAAARCTAPCGMLTAKPSEDIRSRTPVPYAPPPPVGLPIPPRLGIVREAIPALPEVGSLTASSKHKKAHEKRDEKHKELDNKTSAPMEIETGPCGEPKCKSRRKKPADTGSVKDSNTTLSGRRGTNMKRKPKAQRVGKGSKGKGKKRRGHASSGPGGPPGKAGLKPGPGGDITPLLHPEITVSRRITRYVYFVGDYYPGIVYGHKNCIEIPMRIPANMGWLWNTMRTVGKLKPRIGWKPGAIGRYLYELLQEAKENTLSFEESITSLTTRTTDRDRSGRERAARFDRGKAKGGRTDRGKTKNSRGRARIERGRTANDRGRTGSERSRGRETGDRSRSAPSRGKGSPRRGNKTMGFQTMAHADGEEEVESPPTLHIHRKDGTYYVTMHPIRQETSEEPRLSEPMKPLQFKIVKNKDEGSIASSSTASDMEIEFSPPAAVSRYRRKPDVVHVDTQVRQQEILDAIKIDTSKKRDKRKPDGRDKTDSARRRDRRQQEAVDPRKADMAKKKDKPKKERKK